MSSNLQNKLFHFEAPPPPGLWDRIAEDLAADDTFAQRLYNYQQPPPVGVWIKIENGLEDTAPAKVIPFTTRYKKPLRYLAAASFIAVILVAATLLLRRTDAGSLAGANKILSPGLQTPPLTNDTDVASNNPAVDEPSGLQRTSRQAAIVTLKRTLASVRPQTIFPSLSISRKFIPRRAAETALHFASPDNFMVYSDNDGHAMKLPKKLFSLVNCPDGDGSCMERIQQLQQKLAASTVTADFAGMLDIVRQLQ